MSESVRKPAELEMRAPPGEPRSPAPAITKGPDSNGKEPQPSLASVRELRPGRQGILDVARRLFCAQGYERTPLRAVSEALGVTKAAVYYHFKAKEDLLVAVVEPVLDRVDELIQSAGVRFASAGERRAFLVRYVDELRHHADVAGLLLLDAAVREHRLGQRFALQHAQMHALLGVGNDVGAGIRTAMALRALEMVIVEFGDVDPDQAPVTAIAVAIAVLDAEPGAGGRQQA